MISLKNISFIAPSVTNNAESDEILLNLNVLFTTIAGEVPFDREFGLNPDILDLPMPIAEGKLLVEMIDKSKIYEPRAVIKEISFVSNAQNGILYPKVVIEFES